jgi:hypothetical protein
MNMIYVQKNTDGVVFEKNMNIFCIRKVRIYISEKKCNHILLGESVDVVNVAIQTILFEESTDILYSRKVQIFGPKKEHTCFV